MKGHRDRQGLDLGALQSHGIYLIIPSTQLTWTDENNILLAALGP